MNAVNSNKASLPWSKLGLGTGTLASLGRAANLREVVNLLNKAQDLGITVIDTADSYGSGDCEVLLGKAMRETGLHFHIATKAGYRYSNLGWPLRPANQILKKIIHRFTGRQRFDGIYISRCVENSMRRLRVDQLSAFLLHDPPFDAIESDGIQAALSSIKSTGLAAEVGVSSDDPRTLRAAIDFGADVIQTPAGMGKFSALLDIWEECAKRNIRLIGNHIYEPSSLARSDISHEKLMRASSAVMPATSTILCGTRNPTHLAQSLEWARTPMPLKEALLLSEHRA